MTFFLALRVIYAAFLIATTVLGMAFGGRSERLGTMIVLTASLATIFIEIPMLFEWNSYRSGLIAVDILALIAFLCLALKSRRFWPLWATAFHLIAVCSHCVVVMGLSQTLQIYILFQGFWAYPIMVLIIFGALSRQRRLNSGRLTTI
ncbi:hypothetical protein ACNFJ7_13145 [Sphingomonas sp. HT-1]|uniref:hypothetical protein n=1 Tax=unclassified Sphingomonas TaxID=196159 RepID=UPI0003624589|nr:MULTISPECIES: hypothetical protein [unclassified Sphingomonas]KTF69095.1 hypothetical protein ATB93_10550 [Sphingomonas sp. WG]